MRKEQTVNDRAAIVLINEVRRLNDAAERVRLVAEAMALRAGYRPDSDIDAIE